MRLYVIILYIYINIYIHYIIDTVCIYIYIYTSRICVFVCEILETKSAETIGIVQAPLF